MLRDVLLALYIQNQERIQSLMSPLRAKPYRTEDVGWADRGLLIGKEDSQVPDADSASDLRGSVKSNSLENRHSPFLPNTCCLTPCMVPGSKCQFLYLQQFCKLSSQGRQNTFY